MHIPVKPRCTPGRIYRRKGIVHPMYMAPKIRPRLKKQSPLRRVFIRQWREYRDNLTLEKLAERLELNHGIEITHASLSRIERGLQPYNQALLEAIAEELRTDPASLLMRDPTDEEAIWSIWDQAKPGERQQIMAVVRALTKTGT